MHRVHQFVLENGLTAILVPFETTTATIAWTVRGGDRVNPQAYPDLAHALEHQKTRATKLHPTEESFARFCDEFSDGIDAETDETSILITLKTLPRYIPRAVEFMREVVVESVFHPDYIRPEKKRLYHEIEDAKSSRDEALWHLFDKTMLTENGVRGEWIAPPKEDDSSYARYLFFFDKRLFVGRNAAVVVAGKFNKEKVEEAIRRAFSGLPSGSEVGFSHHEYKQFKGKILIVPERRAQVSFILGFPTFGFSHPHRIALGILRNHLSKKPSSRLKLKLDGAGLGYSSSNRLWFWQDIGQYAVQASLSPEQFLAALAVIGKEIAMLRTSLVLRGDLEHAKRNLAVTTRLRFDESRETAQFSAKQWVNLGEVVPLPKYLEQVRRVTSRDIHTVAREIFVKKRMVLVARGPLREVRRKDIMHALQFGRG